MGAIRNIMRNVERYGTSAALESAKKAVAVSVAGLLEYRLFRYITSWIVFVLSLLRSITSTLTLALWGIQDATTVELSWIERFIFLPLLSLSSIPLHIGFIMDGNRRYARSRNAATVVGHKMGYDRLRRVLLWCFELGMEEVSVYAFSVDNFSRSQEEVDYLMDLAETKLVDLCVDGGFIMTNKIRVCICGDKSLLRPSLQAVIQDVEARTADHTRGKFNVLLAYSSKRELSQAVEATLVDQKSIDWSTIRSHLYNSRSVDLIVRTSGETRLSDFLVWQVQSDNTVVVFDKHYWPDYSIVDFMASLLRYNYALWNS